MAQNLERELKALGCDMPADDFREMVVELRAVLFPAWSIDETVCHPIDAIRLCGAARRRAGCNDLPDDLILRTLMNCRRRGLTD